MESNGNQIIFVSAKSYLLYEVIKTICSQMKLDGKVKDDVDLYLKRIKEENLSVISTNLNKLKVCINANNTFKKGTFNKDAVMKIALSNVNLNILSQEEQQELVGIVSECLADKFAIVSLKNVADSYYETEMDRLTLLGKIKPSSDKSENKVNSKFKHNYFFKEFDTIIRLADLLVEANVNHLLSIENEPELKLYVGDEGFEAYNKRRSDFIRKISPLNVEAYKEKCISKFLTDYASYSKRYSIRTASDINQIAAVNKIKEVINKIIHEHIVNKVVITEQSFGFLKQTTKYMNREELYCLCNAIVKSNSYSCSLELLNDMFAHIMSDNFAKDEKSKNLLYSIDSYMLNTKPSDYNLDILTKFKTDIEVMVDLILYYKDYHNELRNKVRRFDHITNNSSGLKR